MAEQTPKKRNPNTGYLAALPEGWQYTALSIEGPGDNRIDIDRNADGSYAVGATVNGTVRKSDAVNLPEALKSAAKGARAVDAAAKALAEAKAAQAEALATLGDLEEYEEPLPPPDDREDDPEA